MAFSLKLEYMAMTSNEGRKKEAKIDRAR